MRSPTLSSFVSCAIGALLSLPAQAVLLTAEPFDYPANLGQGLNTLAGGTGWSAAWSDGNAFPTLATTNNSLSYPANIPLTPTGGRIEVTGDAINDPAARSLGTPINLGLGGQTFYSSALFRQSAGSGLASVLFDRSSDNITRWYYGIDDNGFFSVAVDPSNLAQRSTTTFSAAADTTYLVVARMRTNTGPGGLDEVFLKVYAEGSLVSEPLADADWDIRASGNSGVMLDRVRFAFSNSTGETNEFDEFRVGTSFADVTGIPEPGSASLLAVGTLLLARRRR